MTLVLQALKEPKYFVLAVVFGLLIMAFYAFLQVLPQGLNNFWFWFTLLNPFTWFLYLLYGILFGVTLSFFIWQRAKKIFSVRKIGRVGFLGAFGCFLGTTAPMCLACTPWVTLFLPISVVLPLLRYQVEILVLSVFLLFLALWFLGGFQKQNV
jgi:hypothetical protein